MARRRIYGIHGGGMILGSRAGSAAGLLDWVEHHGVVAVCVEYRLAPEHPYPAPQEDCYAGLVWLAGHAGELGVDPGKILVKGASAGGGLSASVALLARDRGGPALAGQMLICPMLDDRNESISSQQYDGIGIWDRSFNYTGWNALVGADVRGGPDVPPYAAPARATDLGGLAPAFIEVGAAEVFRDETIQYASRIWAAGGQAELHAPVGWRFPRLQQHRAARPGVQDRERDPRRLDHAHPRPEPANRAGPGRPRGRSRAEHARLTSRAGTRQAALPDEPGPAQAARS